jgi:hypothetical protein
MENGFDPLLVSEGHVTIGPKAISVAQDEGGGPIERRLPPTWPGGLTIKNGQPSRTGEYTNYGRRPRPPDEILSRKDLAELQSRLLMVGTSALQDFYRSAHFVWWVGPGQ